MLKQHFPFISHLQPHRDASQGHPASIHETSGPRVRSNLRQGHKLPSGYIAMSESTVCGLEMLFLNDLPAEPLRKTFENGAYLAQIFDCVHGLPGVQQIPLAELLLFETTTMDVGKRKQKDFCQRTNWNLQNGQEEKGKFQRKPYFSDGWKGSSDLELEILHFFLQGAIC